MQTFVVFLRMLKFYNWSLCGDLLAKTTQIPQIMLLITRQVCSLGLIPGRFIVIVQKKYIPGLDYFMIISIIYI